MKWYKKISLIIFIFWLDLKELPGKIKRRIWNKHLLLWWYRLWIRKDEFHPSLDTDGEAMMEMNEKERTAYIDSLIERRENAHYRDFRKKEA